MSEGFLRLTDADDGKSVIRIRPRAINMYYPVGDHQPVTAVAVNGQTIYVTETCRWLDDALELRGE